MERVVEQETLKIYKERMGECYNRERENFPQVCRKPILDYWTAFQAWKKKGIHALINYSLMDPLLQKSH